MEYSSDENVLREESYKYPGALEADKMKMEEMTEYYKESERC